MSLTIYLAPLVMCIGALVFLLSKDGKRAEMGKIAYAAGLLITLYGFMSKAFHF